MRNLNAPILFLTSNKFPAEEPVPSREYAHYDLKIEVPRTRSLTARIRGGLEHLTTKVVHQEFITKYRVADGQLVVTTDWPAVSSEIPLNQEQIVNAELLGRPNVSLLFRVLNKPFSKAQEIELQVIAPARISDSALELAIEEARKATDFLVGT